MAYVYNSQIYNSKCFYQLSSYRNLAQFQNFTCLITVQDNGLWMCEKNVKMAITADFRKTFQPSKTWPTIYFIWRFLKGKLQTVQCLLVFCNFILIDLVYFYLLLWSQIPFLRAKFSKSVLDLNLITCWKKLVFVLNVMV